MFVIGLGNPGLTYKKTRHNIGFMFIDYLRGKGKPNRICKSYLYKGDEKIEGFIKPLTYMNLSGRAIQCFITKQYLKKDNFIVCYDDVDLPFGSIRLKNQGSSGGHKGIESIIEHLGNNEFMRLRFGISKDETMDMKDYVLSNFSETEMTQLPNIFERAQQALYTIVNEGFKKAQTIYNRRNYE